VHDTRQRLETQVKKLLGPRRVSFECWVLVGDPFQQIMAAARTTDLIVMATAGRTGLSHLVIGSVAEKVVRHSPAPVLTIRSAIQGAGKRTVRSERLRRRPRSHQAMRVARTKRAPRTI
jgi:nucleotide-binding universal stress UspA family protein